jgi:hypothetical protein
VSVHRQEPWRARAAAQLEQVLDSFAARLVLSALIIASLLPWSITAGVDAWFFAVFAVEFVARGFVVLSRPGGQARGTTGLGGLEDRREVARDDHRPFGGWALLVVDALALLSFVPTTAFPGVARWLRLLRLARMLLLVGYWSALVADLWTILARRERIRQVVLMGMVVAGLSFAGSVFLVHVGAPPLDLDEDGQPEQVEQQFLHVLWWAFRQIQDPGNMVPSPEPWSALLVSLGLTVFGLFLVSFLIGLGTDVVRELLELSRLRPPQLRRHTIIVNITPSTRRLLQELMGYRRKLIPQGAVWLSPAWFRKLARNVWGARYLVVGRTDEPPDFLRKPEFAAIVYRQASGHDEVSLGRTDALQARRFVLLADFDDADPDAETLRSMLTITEALREAQEDGRLPERAGRGPDRKVLVAEVLDETNLAAARSAAVAGRELVRTFVVPTEKLLALFFASTLRRPGVDQLLEELLTSSGHEIYTCFFDMPGLSFGRADVPALGRNHAEAMAQLLAAGLASRERIVPIGLLRRAVPSGSIGRDFEVEINPHVDDASAADDVRGFIAIADNFEQVRGFARGLPRELQLGSPALTAPSAADRVAAGLRRSPTPRCARVLVCGFRPGTLYLIEALALGAPEVEVVLLVRDAATRRRVRESLVRHTRAVDEGLLSGDHLRVVPDPGVVGDERSACDRYVLERGRWVHRRDRGTRSTCRLVVTTADWADVATLVELPHGIGPAIAFDGVVFVATSEGESDPRTTTALLQLDQLVERARDRDAAAAAGSGDAAVVERPHPHGPRIVAEVFDPRLARRLEHRFAASRNGLLGARCRAVSIQELRAFFLFQSVLVPGFDAVYDELMAGWGHSFVRLEPPPLVPGVAGDGVDPRTALGFADLAIALRQRNVTLLAVELHAPDRDGDGEAPGERATRTTLVVAPAEGQFGDRFTRAQLVALWVIAADAEGHDPNHAAVPSPSAPSS